MSNPLPELYRSLVHKRKQELDPWYQSYKSFVEDIQQIREALQKGLQLTDHKAYIHTSFAQEDDPYNSFTYKLIYDKENGISRKGQSSLSWDDFENLRNAPEFQKLIPNIVLDPSFENYQQLNNFWKNNLPKQNHLLINRVFTACHTGLTTTVYSNKFDKVFDNLQSAGFIEKYLNTSPQDWYHKNLFVKEQIGRKLKDFEDIDTYWLSIFYWELTGQDAGFYHTNTHTIHTNYSLNQILYGPPGTGKTYKLQNEYFDLFISKEDKITEQQKLTEIVEQLPWWKVIALALLELQEATTGEIYKHHLVQIKADISNGKTPDSTVSAQLYIHSKEVDTSTDDKNKRYPLIFIKNEQKQWSIIQDKVEEEAPKLIEIKNQLASSTNSSSITQKNYQFVTFHQSFVYEDFIEGIKPQIQAEDSITQDVLTYTIEQGTFYKACFKALQLAGYTNFKQCLEDTKENRQKKFEAAPKYAVFIDEINRGNVSAIFGELITLIEESKRLGSDEELTVTLPYSKTVFGVPANLYIIGTMNTADRSIEALDTALRRRFSFEEMPPNPSLITSDGDLQEEEGVLAITNDYSIALEKLLTIINRRIEVLLNKDHLIGHSFFMPVKDTEGLQQAFARQIIPLLQEYFYGDYGKMALVLGEGFCAKKPQPSNTKLFAVTDYDGSFIDDKVIYEVKVPEGDEFVEALKKLMNQPQTSNG
ncbi:MAG TPA: hypothetical protein DCS93_23955 [Microscillaceae bacterium]|nr:hypothetical protein [Microscillaceae bacterium]